MNQAGANLLCKERTSADIKAEPPAHDQPPVLEKNWRFYAGMTALVLALVLPLLALAVPLLGLSVATSAVLVGALVAGGPEVLILLAAALLGKNVLHYFMAQIKQFLCVTLRKLFVWGGRS